MRLVAIRVASKEMVLSFEKDGRQLHLICTPEGHLVTPPEGQGQPFVHITGMKYETGTGELSILADSTELAGEAVEVIGLEVSQATHDPRNHVFGLQLGPNYGVIITPGGMKVLYTKELEVEFRKPLVIV
jgi:hypothetical protein